jgi:hypothetical protein
MKAVKKIVPPVAPEAPKGKPEAAKKPEGPTVGMVLGTDGALKFDARWTPEARAVVGTVRDAGLSVVRAGVTAVGALVELFAMGMPGRMGFERNDEFGQSLVGAFQFEGAARSTAYGWVKVASAQHACNAAKVPTEALPSDVLKLVHQHGNGDPALMAKVATDLLNEPTIRNGRGTVDAKKALGWFEGDGEKASHGKALSRKEKVQSLAKKAKRLGGNKDAGIDLLKEAIALLAKA